MEKHAYCRPSDVHFVTFKQFQHAGNKIPRIGEVLLVLRDRPLFKSTPVEFEIERDDEGSARCSHMDEDPANLTLKDERTTYLYAHMSLGFWPIT